MCSIDTSIDNRVRNLQQVSLSIAITDSYALEHNCLDPLVKLA